MAHIFLNKPEFAEPIRVLFLCGSEYSSIDKFDKRTILKKHLEQNKKNRVILLEKYFDFPFSSVKSGLLSYYKQGLFNLYNIELLAALVATNIIVIHESLSTAGEIGVFASNSSLRDRIITLVPQRYSVEEEKLSNFLKLAFWNDSQVLINNQIIRFYPRTERIMVSKTNSYYQTYFQDNKLPESIEHKLNNHIKDSVVSVFAFGDDNFTVLGSNVTVYLDMVSVKNYILAILSLCSVRTQLRKCTLLYDVNNTIKKFFRDSMKETYYNKTGERCQDLKIVIKERPDLDFETVIKFMVYCLHACNIMKITKNEDGTITVSFAKRTSKIWKKYSELIQYVDFSEWGD